MAKQMSPAAIKKLQRWFLAAAALIVVALFFIFREVRKENTKLLAEGTRAKVVIVDKIKRGTRKLPQYQLKVAFFTKGEEVALFQEKDTTNMTAVERKAEMDMRKIFGKMKRNKLGDYQSFTIHNVTSGSYDGLKRGDSATLVYYPDQPTKGMLLRDLE